MRITNKPNDLVSVFTEAPQGVDAMRLAQLKRWSDFSDLERPALETERKRLESKYGAGSPQVQSAEARLGSFDMELVSLKAEIVRQSIAPPETQPESFVVYGRVLDSSGNPVRRVIVTAVGANNAVLARSSTRDLGEFEIRVALGKPKSGSKKTEDAATPSVSFQLQVADAKRVLLKDKEAFQAIGDRITYRELVITAIPDRRVSAKAPPRAKPKR
jgi:hypothetical protein